jgi:lipoate-protein ligase A
MKYKLYISECFDPYINLSIENDLLMNIKEGEKYLFLYRNLPCVVIGRFQNPWLECHMEELEERQIPLVRRQSGGGTVYHDMENLNFSFIDSKRDFDKKENNKIVIETLALFGIEAFASGRNDIMVKDREGQDRKISGSAFKQKKDRSFHHGTLLVDSKLDDLHDLLHPPNMNITTKSIPSVRSKVINLAELKPGLTIENLLAKFLKVFPSEETVFVDAHNDSYSNHLKSWEWMIGETPKFKIEYKNLSLEVKKGIIIDGPEDLINSKFSLSIFDGVGLLS